MALQEGPEGWCAPISALPPCGWRAAGDVYQAHVGPRGECVHFGRIPWHPCLGLPRLRNCLLKLPYLCCFITRSGLRQAADALSEPLKTPCVRSWCPCPSLEPGGSAGAEAEGSAGPPGPFLVGLGAGTGGALIFRLPAEEGAAAGARSGCPGMVCPSQMPPGCHKVIILLKVSLLLTHA